MIILDATNLILGKLATKAAKLVLEGEQIAIINSEEAVITGNKVSILKHYKRKKDMGKPEKGPFFPKEPDRILKRTIRGMLPHRTSHGRDALSNVKCYKGVPVELQGKESITLDNANISNSNAMRFIKLKEVSNFVGAKQ